MLAAPYTFYLANPSSRVLARLSDDQRRVDEMLSKCELKLPFTPLRECFIHWCMQLRPRGPALAPELAPEPLTRNCNHRWLHAANLACQHAANLPPPALSWTLVLCSLPGLRDSAGHDAVLCDNGHHLLAVSCYNKVAGFAPLLTACTLPAHLLQFGCSALCHLLLPAAASHLPALLLQIHGGSIRPGICAAGLAARQGVRLPACLHCLPMLLQPLARHLTTLLQPPEHAWLLHLLFAVCGCSQGAAARGGVGLLPRVARVHRGSRGRDGCPRLQARHGGCPASQHHCIRPQLRPLSKCQIAPALAACIESST